MNPCQEADNNLSYEEYLLGVLEQEIQQRNTTGYKEGQQAGFPVITLRTLILKFHLQQA